MNYSFGLSSVCTMLGIMACTFTILSACGISQYVKKSVSKRNAIIKTLCLLVVTALMWTSSYLLYPKCPACNSTQNTVYCTKCGTRVTEEYPKCSNCNIEVKTDFCGQCGHNVNGE